MRQGRREFTSALFVYRNMGWSAQARALGVHNPLGGLISNVTDRIDGLQVTLLPNLLPWPHSL
ncbi:MAG TPA: hypothetical protein VF932_11715 [Anaerolineae bacterium]